MNPPANKRKARSDRFDIHTFLATWSTQIVAVDIVPKLASDCFPYFKNYVHEQYALHHSKAFSQMYKPTGSTLKTPLRDPLTSGSNYASLGDDDTEKGNNRQSEDSSVAEKSPSFQDGRAGIRRHSDGLKRKPPPKWLVLCCKATVVLGVFGVIVLAIVMTVTSSSEDLLPPLNSAFVACDILCQGPIQAIVLGLKPPIYADFKDFSDLTLLMNPEDVMKDFVQFNASHAFHQPPNIQSKLPRISRQPHCSVEWSSDFSLPLWLAT